MSVERALVFETLSKALGRTILPRDIETAGYRLREVERIGEQEIREVERGRERVVLLARTTSAALRRSLRQAGISYVDSRGNAFVDLSPLPFLVENGLKRQADSGRKPGTAFGKAGLKITFLLLVDPTAIGDTYRRIGDRAGVSVRTVKIVVDDLVAHGYIRKLGRGRSMTRELGDRSRLAKRWPVGFAELLRPKIVHGRFRFLSLEDRHSWKTIDLAPARALWGGEPAANLAGFPLRPEVLTIYTRGGYAHLAKTLRLVPDPAGDVEVLTTFWEPEPEIHGDRAVPLLLTFADLSASGAARNLDIATSVFDSWLDEGS
ncbi:MAG: hypothetical protein ACI80V_000055 [Rhodothermales bacterium]|jgi:hypothetical protein